MNLVVELMEEFTEPFGDSSIDFREPVMLVAGGGFFFRRHVSYFLLMLFEERRIDFELLSLSVEVLSITLMVVGSFIF